jgi:hypothetical protein
MLRHSLFERLNVKSEEAVVTTETTAEQQQTCCIIDRTASALQLSVLRQADRFSCGYYAFHNALHAIKGLSHVSYRKKKKLMFLFDSSISHFVIT